MSFLLDTDTCSVYLKGDPHLFNRFLQHGGALHVSTVTVGELYTWACGQPPRPSGCKTSRLC